MRVRQTSFVNQPFSICNVALTIPHSFEGRLKKLRWWLDHVEKRMTTDLLEANQCGPEKTVLEQLEEYQQDILKERSVMSSLNIPKKVS